MSMPIGAEQLTSFPKNPSGYFIRHAPTDWNLKGLTMGQADVPLGSQGTELLNKELPRLTELEIGALYSSPLKRCLQTAEPLSRKLGLSIVCIPELMERDWGVFEGIPKSARNLDEDPEKGETLAAFRHRVSTALDIVSDRAVLPLLVTHSGVIRELKRLLGSRSVNCAVPHLKPIPFLFGGG